LHARPVLRFVDLASKFASTIRVQKRDTSVDGKSPMEMMLLEATQGTVLKIVAEGDDCLQAVDELAKLVSDGFGEE
jgi:phosphocarrier protein